MHDYSSDYIIRKSYLTSGLCNLEVFFKKVSELHNPKTTLWGDTRKTKMYFLVYGGAGRNSLGFEEKPSKCCV